jgi:Zn-dependent M28 family amino/carboxypeptidase
MDFVVGLPHTWRGKDAVWVVMDRFSKVVHFIPIRTTDFASDLAPIYAQEIVVVWGSKKKHYH